MYVDQCVQHSEIRLLTLKLFQAAEPVDGIFLCASLDQHATDVNLSVEWHGF